MEGRGDGTFGSVSVNSVPGVGRALAEVNLRPVLRAKA